MKHANFVVVDDQPDHLTIRDVGPWNRHPTITNDAEYIVEYVVKYLNLSTRRLLYIDSDGQMDELVVRDGQFFAGFRPYSILKGDV